MKFSVPQFIEVEDKIFGPLTLKQFIYLAGGGAFIFVLYAVTPLWLTIILGAPIAVFTIALAFLKINNQPFIKLVQNALKYNTRSKLFLWKKRQTLPSQTTQRKTEEKQEVIAPKLSKKKLQDLAWSLDIKEKIK